MSCDLRYAELEQYTSLDFKPTSKKHCDEIVSKPTVFIKLDAGIVVKVNFFALGSSLPGSAMLWGWGICALGPSVPLGHQLRWLSCCFVGCPTFEYQLREDEVGSSTCVLPDKMRMIEQNYSGGYLESLPPLIQHPPSYMCTREG